MKEENLPRWIRRLLQRGKATYKTMPTGLDDVIVNKKGKVIYRIPKPADCLIPAIF